MVNVFADQLHRYAQYHPGFTFEPPQFTSLWEVIYHVVLDVITAAYVYCSHLIQWKKIECPICLDDAEKIVVVFPCCHFMCISCSRHWYEDKIDRGATCDTLTCASPNCRRALSLVNIRKTLTLDSEVKLRYNHFVKAVGSIAEDNKLACPEPDCPGYIIRIQTNTSSHDYDEDSEFASCPLCFINDKSSVYCFKCRKRHSKEEHNALSNLLIFKTNKIMKSLFGFSFNGSETESEKLVRKLKLVTKKCPACGIPCEKDEACNHCTCLNCGVEFNWAQERIWEGYSEEFRRNAVFNG